MKRKRRIILGRVQFNADENTLVIHQQWNPSLMSAEDRRRIGWTLIEIGERMRQDEFEEDGVFVHWAPSRENVRTNKPPKIGDASAATSELRAAGLDAWDGVENPEELPRGDETP